MHARHREPTMGPAIGQRQFNDAAGERMERPRRCCIRLWLGASTAILRPGLLRGEGVQPRADVGSNCRPLPRAYSISEEYRIESRVKSTESSPAADLRLP